MVMQLGVEGYAMQETAFKLFFFFFASTEKQLSLKGGAQSVTCSLWLMESGGLWPDLGFGCCEDLFSVGSMTVA